MHARHRPQFLARTPQAQTARGRVHPSTSLRAAFQKISRQTAGCAREARRPVQHHRCLISAPFSRAGQDPARSPGRSHTCTLDALWQATPVRRGYSLASQRATAAPRRNGDTRSTQRPSACHLRPGRCRDTLGPATSLPGARLWACVCPCSPNGQVGPSRDWVLCRGGRGDRGAQTIPLLARGGLSPSISVRSFDCAPPVLLRECLVPSW